MLFFKNTTEAVLKLIILLVNAYTCIYNDKTNNIISKCIHMYIYNAKTNNIISKCIHMYIYNAKTNNIISKSIHMYIYNDKTQNKAYLTTLIAYQNIKSYI